MLNSVSIHNARVWTHNLPISNPNSEHNFQHHFFSRFFSLDISKLTNLLSSKIAWLWSDMLKQHPMFRNTAPAPVQRCSALFSDTVGSWCYIRLRTCPSGSAKPSLLQQQSQGIYLFQHEIKPCPSCKIPTQCHLLKMHFSQGAMCLSVTHSCRALEPEDNTRGGEGGGKKGRKIKY